MEKIIIILLILNIVPASQWSQELVPIRLIPVQLFVYPWKMHPPIVKCVMADSIKCNMKGGSIAQRFSPSSPGFESQHSRNFFRGKIIGVFEVNQWPWLEESGQRLENDYHTHLVLASGKPVLQKNVVIIVTHASESLSVELDLRDG